MITEDFPDISEIRTLLQMDFMDDDAPEKLIAAMNSEKADIVISTEHSDWRNLKSIPGRFS